MRRYLRSRFQHHFVLEHERHGDEYNLWHLNGNTTRCRRGSSILGDKSYRITGDRDRGDRKQRNDESCVFWGLRVAESVALLVVDGGPTIDTDTDTHSNSNTLRLIA